MRILYIANIDIVGTKVIYSIMCIWYESAFGTFGGVLNVFKLQIASTHSSCDAVDCFELHEKKEKEKKKKN